MEYNNLRAIYLPDMEGDTSVYNVIRDAADNLQWTSDGSDLSIPFQHPFSTDKWMVMQSVLEEDSSGRELFEMDIVEVRDQEQRYYLIVRVGHRFSLFDGSREILNDPNGTILMNCKYVCPIWEAHTITGMSPRMTVNNIIRTKVIDRT